MADRLQTLALPETPEGCTLPEWRPLHLPIDPRAWVLIGECWWQAQSVVVEGGAWWLVAMKDGEG